MPPSQDQIAISAMNKGATEVGATAAAEILSGNPELDSEEVLKEVAAAKEIKREELKEKLLKAHKEKKGKKSKNEEDALKEAAKVQVTGPLPDDPMYRNTSPPGPAPSTASNLASVNPARARAKQRALAKAAEEDKEEEENPGSGPKTTTGSSRTR